MRNRTFTGTKIACYTGYIVQGIINNIAPLLFVIFSDKFDITLERLSLLITINFATQLTVDALSIKFADIIGFKKLAVVSQGIAFIGLSCLGILPNILSNAYIGIVIAIMLSAIVVIAINVKDMFASFGEALHHSAFQVSSVMTTTGYATTDFNQWPELSRMIMLAVMCVGACAGSTGGGLKVSRVIILLKSARREFRRISHPRSVKIITFDGNRVSDDTIRNTFAYFFIYVMIFAASVLVVALDNFDFTTTVTSVIATLNNIGPGLNMVGATGNFSEFGFLSKLVLIADMLLGRLEIFPLLFLFAPSKQKVKIFSKIRSKF